jgi:hypothetical protein
VDNVSSKANQGHRENQYDEKEQTYAKSDISPIARLVTGVAV